MLMYDLGGGEYINLLDIKEILDNAIRTGENVWIDLDIEQRQEIIQI